MIKHLPNILTLLRLVMTLVFLAMVLYSPQFADQPHWLFLDTAFVIFVVAGLTDIADGKIARKYNVTSKFGRIVDPLADKILVCGAFICFAIIGEPKLFSFTPKTLAIIHWSFAGIIIIREMFVTILRHWSEAKGINFAATASGKLKMALQTFAIGTVMVKMAHVQTAAWGYWFTSITFILTVMVTVVSGALSVRKTRSGTQ